MSWELKTFNLHNVKVSQNGCGQDGLSPSPGPDGVRGYPIDGQVNGIRPQSCPGQSSLQPDAGLGPTQERRPEGKEGAMIVCHTNFLLLF